MIFNFKYIREMQIKTTVRYLFTPIHYSQKDRQNKCSKDVEKMERSLVDGHSVQCFNSFFGLLFGSPLK
jgi:hypothetical protein